MELDARKLVFSSAPLLFALKVSIFWLISVAEESGLSLFFPKPQRLVLPSRGSIMIKVHLRQLIPQFLYYLINQTDRKLRDVI